MAAAFAAVGVQNLLGDNTTQARLLFAPMALTLSAACTVTARSFARAGWRRRTPDDRPTPS